VIYPDSISKFIETINKKKVSLVVGRYSTEPLNPGLVQYYKALFDYVFLIPRELKHTVFLNGQIGGGCDFINTDTFRELNGFDDSIAGANVEREEFYLRLFDAGHQSAANPMIKTRHHFPKFFTMIKNFQTRIPPTMELMERRSAYFTYDQRFKIALPAAASSLGILGFLSSGSYMEAMALICTGIFFLSSFEFLAESIKRRGAMMTLEFIPLHIFVLNLIMVIGANALLQNKLRKLKWF